MSDIFLSRSKAEYGTAIVKYNNSTWDSLAETLYLMGRRPDKYYAEIKETKEWKDFLAAHDVSPQLPLRQLSQFAAQELALQVTDRAIMGNLVDDIVGKIKSHPEKKFSSIRVAAPFPIDEHATSNNFAPALAAAVTAGLEVLLPSALRKNGLPPLPIFADLDPHQPDPNRRILNIVNNQRGKTSDPREDEKVQTYMERVVRQPVYSGSIDRNALYVPVDDFLVSQSTVASLINYIQANGAVTSSALTGVKLFKGTEVLSPQQETLDLLKMAVRDALPPPQDTSAQISFMNRINKTLNKVGLHIDAQDIKNTDLSNIELLFVAGYFADGQNPKHQEAFARALRAIGASPEDARGNSASDIFHSKPGTLAGLENIYKKSLEERLLLIPPSAARYQDLENKGADSFLQPSRTEAFGKSSSSAPRLETIN